MYGFMYAVLRTGVCDWRAFVPHIYYKQAIMLGWNNPDLNALCAVFPYADARLAMGYVRSQIPLWTGTPVQMIDSIVAQYNFRYLNTRFIYVLSKCHDIMYMFCFYNYNCMSN